MILLLQACVLSAQNTYHLHLSLSQAQQDSLEYKAPAQALDSTAVIREAQLLKEKLWASGYLNASGSLHYYTDSAFLNVSPGRAFNYSTIRMGSADSLLDAPLFSNIAPKQSFKRAEDLIAHQQLYLDILQENGYPFAQTRLGKWQLNQDTLVANLQLDPGPYITLDSLIVKGYTKFSKHVLRYTLNFKKGMPYSETYVKTLSKNIGNVEYLQFTASPALAFSEDKTTLYLYIEEVKSNQVDGIIGLNTNEDGSTSFNGEFKLRLLNILKSGEEIKLQWRRPDESVQSLNAALAFPFVFNTPFWLAGELNIFRQDSSFVNTDAEGLLKYYLGGGGLLSGGLGYRVSNTLGNENSGFANFTTTQYKLGLEWYRTDRVLIPRKGYQLSTFGFTANRKTSAQNSAQYGWEIDVVRYFLVGSKHVALAHLNSSSLFGENLFTNELYRIGGLRTLRGFNEQQIYASSYAIGTLEYRYMIGNYDYLALFSDVAFAENTANAQYSSNVYTGLGAGFSFNTGAGIFSLFYAIGRDLENTFDFRTSKVHFGYISRF